MTLDTMAVDEIKVAHHIWAKGFHVFELNEPFDANGSDPVEPVFRHDPRKAA